MITKFQYRNKSDATHFKLTLEGINGVSYYLKDRNNIIYVWCIGRAWVRATIQNEKLLTKVKL